MFRTNGALVARQKLPTSAALRTAVCPQFQQRPNAAAVFAAAADRLDPRVAEKREAVERSRQMTKWFTEELHELELERGDPGVDLAWAGFEPAGFHDTS